MCDPLCACVYARSADFASQYAGAATAKDAKGDKPDKAGAPTDWTKFIPSSAIPQAGDSGLAAGKNLGGQTPGFISAVSWTWNQPLGIDAF